MTENTVSARNSGTDRPRWEKVRRPESSLFVRIMGMNILAIFVLAMGIFYVSQYRESLIKSELQQMKREIELISAAIGEGATRQVDRGSQIEPDAAQRMASNLADTRTRRVRVYASDGQLITDTHGSLGPATLLAGGPDTVRTPVPETIDDAFAYLVNMIPINFNLPDFPLDTLGEERLFPDIKKALEGNATISVWRAEDGGLIITAVAPVFTNGEVNGAVFLINNDTKIEAASADVRVDVLRLFIVALAITITVSVYLSGVIARPIRKLALAAESIRQGKGRETIIPDMSERGDEIGELSLALKDMTQALWARMDSIERFAADVAHELKNPLTSLRSAVETVRRVHDEDDKKRLLDIIQHDVDRLDRLITDISSASRLDTELSRDKLEDIDLKDLLLTIRQMYEPHLSYGTEEKPADKEHRIHLHFNPPGKIFVLGNADRLTQVFENLISNALSFTPPDKGIDIFVKAEKDVVTIKVCDQGPGIPESKLEAIFDRFYTQRPEEEAFGRHSGLGLSIARQIIESHSGSLHAENIVDDNTQVQGACFVVKLATS